jgi:hypothetical protein
MKKLTVNQRGFIPLLICVLLVVGGIVFLVYTRVIAGRP